MFQHFLIDDTTFEQYPFHGICVLREKIINQLINDKYESIRNRFHFDSRFV